MAVALVAAVTARPSFAGIGDDVDSAFQRPEQYGNIEITNKHSAGIQKEAEKGFRNAQKRGKEVEGWKGRIKSDGNGNFYVDKAPASKRQHDLQRMLAVVGRWERRKELRLLQKIGGGGVQVDPAERSLNT